MKKRTNIHAPPANLSAEAKRLWRATVEEFEFESGADLALLRQLCESIDGVRACQKRVRKDGMMIRGASGQLRHHPLLAAEAEYRRAVLACVRALRITSAPEL